MNGPPFTASTPVQARVPPPPASRTSASPGDAASPPPIAGALEPEPVVLRRIAWAGLPSSAFSAARLGAMITEMRSSNLRNHVSGMLLYTGVHFVEILEGEQRVLDAMWSRVQHDDRYAAPVRLGDEACNARWFADWKMAYADDQDVGAQVDALRARTTPSASGWSADTASIMARADSM
jgi:hypothetical protein